MTRSRVAAMSPAEPELKAFAQDVGRNAPSKLPPTVVVQISACLRRWGLDRRAENRSPMWLADGNSPVGHGVLMAPA